ncbi:hypothetical protein QVA64_12260, partial [Staphylococcus haemolyticus]
RAENNQKIYKKDNFYIISIEIVFFSLIQELYVPDSFFTYPRTLCPGLFFYRKAIMDAILLSSTFNYINNYRY